MLNLLYLYHFQDVFLYTHTILLQARKQIILFSYGTPCYLILIFCTYESQIYFERFCKILTWVKHFFLRYNKMKWCGNSLGESKIFYFVNPNKIFGFSEWMECICLNKICCLVNFLRLKFEARSFRLDNFYSKVLRCFTLPISTTAIACLLILLPRRS